MSLSNLSQAFGVNVSGGAGVLVVSYLLEHLTTRFESGVELNTDL